LKTLLRRLIDARAFQPDQRARINILTAFAYNLMGVLFDGVMEYNSMYFGSAFLYLLALGLCAGLGVFAESRSADSKRA
jgi:hypothetical protein